MFGLLLLLLSVLTVVNADEMLCDPLSQYEKGGQCCKMCEPGKKMVDANCHTPKCEPCRSNEYRDTYTTEAQCERQPYCDPNKGFADPHHKTDKKTVCMCKEEFYCSSKVCLYCLPHQACGPGKGVQYRGNHTHDTVCQDCPEGTFSNVTSMVDGCVKHTKCPLGLSATVRGTAQSDTVCETNRHVHIALAVVVGVFILAVLIAAGLYFKRKKSLNNTEKILDVCLESIGPKEDPTKPMLQKTPVENEDSSLLSRCSEEHGRSENGKIVCPVVEEGKAECLSRQESQLSGSSTVSYSLSHN